nr:unnamed protein product [Digitaria exilis]
MTGQSKRPSLLESGNQGHSGKKARALAMLRSVIKQEQKEVGGVEEEEEKEEDKQEEGEVNQGSSAGAMVAVEDMETEPQLNVRLGLSLFHCRACHQPLKPPTFKCEAGHVICASCCNSHGEVCSAAAIFSPCVEVDAFVRDAKQPCAFEEFDCESAVVYFDAADHHRACRWAPCSCPDPGCGFLSSPARLVDHFAAAHAWPVTEVSYGKPHRGCHVLVGRDDRCVFLLSPCALGGAAAAVALVCVRANGGGDAAAQFNCKLWAETAGSSGAVSMTMMMCEVGSSSMSGGFSAADQEMFMVVPPRILHEVPGEVPFNCFCCRCRRGQVHNAIRQERELKEDAVVAWQFRLQSTLHASPPKSIVLPLAMSEQQRVSTPESHGGKRTRAQAIADGGVKLERREQREASQGGDGEVEGEGALVVAVQAMEEPQIGVRISVSRLHCHACHLPLKPPTFKCEAGHVVCFPCRGSHGQYCAGAAVYAACVELDNIVRDTKVPCAYEAYGCTSWPVYYEVEDHHRSCRCRPCFCPESGCEFFSSPARLAEHFASEHDWPVTKIAYQKPCKLAVAGPQDREVLVAESDGCVFLVSTCAFGAATSLSLVCVRSIGDAAAAVPQFRCKLWAEVEANKENLSLVTSLVANSDLSGGFVAADQGMFLAVQPPLLLDESGEAPVLKVRIDKCQVPVRHSAAEEAHQETAVVDELTKRLQAMSEQRPSESEWRKKTRARVPATEGEPLQPAAAVELQAMEEPQLNLMIGVSLLHCQACFLPLNPPTFTCQAGLVVCCTCRGKLSHAQPCPELDAFVRDAKMPCQNEEFGCKSLVVYYLAADHRGACQWAPCFCPVPGCKFVASPARLGEHLNTRHRWPITTVRYGEPCKLPVPTPERGCHAHVLVGEGDRSVFLVSPSALGAATAVSLVCVRANAAGGQFKSTLWVELPCNKDKLVLMMTAVRSGDLSGGSPEAGTNLVLTVPPVPLHDASGEAPNLFVCIDKANAAAPNSTPAMVE